MMARKKVKTDVDLLIINNVPSFFKVNLYNELAQRCRIHVIFLALTDQAIINDSFLQDMRFPFNLISHSKIEKRNILGSFIKLLRICKRFTYKKVIFGGYADLESLAMMFLMPKKKNCLQFESTIKESTVRGVKALLKKIVMGRHGVALPSGLLHAEVFRSLGYKGMICTTHGVGLINTCELLKVRELRDHNSSRPALRYLYVGRMIREKNLELLIHVFNEINRSLTMVGTGVLTDKLAQMAKNHVVFRGFVSHDHIHEEYLQHDVLILPSMSETWGLVVEEAICAGLPVVVSDAVGCRPELVDQLQTGVVFQNGSRQSLIDAITQIEATFDTYKNNCQRVDFSDREQSQVDAYLQVIDMTR